MPLAVADRLERRADRVRDAEHVRQDHLAPVLGRVADEAALGAEAGVGEDDVDAAEAVERGLARAPRCPPSRPTSAGTASARSSPPSSLASASSLSCRARGRARRGSPPATARRAVAAPIPVEAPVMRKTLRSSSAMGSFPKLGWQHMLYDKARIFVQGGGRRERRQLVPPRGPRSPRRSRRRRRRPRRATSCCSATTRCATCRASSAGRTTRPSAAATARARCATAPAARTSSSACRPARRSTDWDGTAYDLVVPGTRVVIARGGPGGRGNKRFATATRQAPRFAERGLPGAEGWVDLQLKLLADVGLVGRAERGQVVAARAAHARGAEGRRLPVHDARAGARHARGRGPPARDRRHPGPDRGRVGGRRPRPRLPRARRAHAAARPRARPRAARRLGPGGELRDDRGRARRPRRAAGGAAARARAVEGGPRAAEEAARAAVAAWRERLGDGRARCSSPRRRRGLGLDELAAELLHRVPLEAPARRREALAAEEELAEHRTFRPAAEPRLERRARARPAASASRASRSSGCSPATTSTTTRRSRTSSTACTGWAWSARSRPPGFEPGDDVEIAGVVFELDPG